MARMCNDAWWTKTRFHVSGLVKRSTRHWVTAKSLDGLFLMTGEEQRKIRRDPVGSGGAILKQAIGG